MATAVQGLHEQLGAVELSCRTRPGAIAKRVACGVLLLLLGFAGLIGSIALYLQVRNAAVIGNDGRWAPVIALGLLGIFGLFLATLLLRASHRLTRGRLHICSQGLVWGAEEAQEVVPWRDLESIACSIAKNNVRYFIDDYTLQFVGSNNRKFEVTNNDWALKVNMVISCHELNLVHMLAETKFVAERVEQTLHELRSGKTVAFGELLVDNHSMNWRGRIIPWVEITELAEHAEPINGGRYSYLVKLRSQEQIWLIDNRVRNVALLRAILQQRLGHPTTAVEMPGL